MKLKPEEVRIGNTVTNSRGDVFNIETGAFYLYHQNKEWDCIGIELTEEWMLKFGAEKIFSINYIAGFKISDIIFWQEEDGFFHLPTETKIKYVHRLQNFFYELKNEELTIKETELK